MKLTPQTQYVNIPIDSRHYCVHGLIQMCAATAFYLLRPASAPAFLAFAIASAMFAIGCYTFSRHLEVSETLKNLSSTNKFTITKEWIKKFRVNPSTFYLGKGFLWGTECTQIYHQLINLPLLEKIVNLEPEGGGKIFLHNIGKDKEEQRFHELPEHTIVAGTTGVGKTQALKLLVTQIVANNEAVIVIDPKGDRDFLNSVYRIAVQAGRKQDFQFFSLLHPESSGTFDLFGDCIKASEVADRMKSVIADTGASDTTDPFLAFCWTLIHATADLLLATRQKITPARIYRSLVIDNKELYSHGENMLRRSSALAEQETLQSALEVYKAKIVDHPEEHASKMTSVLVPMLTILGKGETGKLLSPEVANLQIADIINNKRIVYINLASMSYQRESATIGKLIVQNIVGHIGKEYGYSRQLKGVHLVVDEFYSVAYPGYIEMLNKARAAGLHLYLGMQTSADIAATLGPVGVEQVLGNTNNYIILRIPEAFFAEVVAARCGKTVAPQKVKTRSINAGMDRYDHLFRSGHAERMDMVEVERISPETLNSLPKGEAFFISGGKPPIKLALPMLAESGEYIESFFELLNPEQAFAMGNMDNSEAQMV